MADVFISYCKSEGSLTKALARDLETEGYSVWWDTALLAGNVFPEIIRRQIRDARAAIVIWTQNSVKSTWVYAEAQEAHRLKKLIPARVESLDVHDIPLPFGALHTELLSDRKKIYAAVSQYVPVIEDNKLQETTILVTDNPPHPPPIAPDVSKENPSDQDTISRTKRELAEIYFGHGLVYLEGRGVPTDINLAAGYISKAAQLGLAQAISLLGQMYLEGRGVATDFVKGRLMLYKAAELGDDAAKKLIKRYAL